MVEDKRLLAFGGLSGILSGALTGIIFGIVVVAFPQSPSLTGESLVNQFAESGALFSTVLQILAVAFLLFILFIFALVRSLRRAAPSTALLGGVFAILCASLAVIFFFAADAVGSGLASLAAEATAPEETAIILVAAETAVQIFLGVLTAAILFLGVGLLFLGYSMLSAPDFQASLGWFSLSLGIVGFGLVFIPGVQIFIAFFPWLAFSLVLGGKVYGLSKGV